jgi:hypothetical protein
MPRDAAGNLLVGQGQCYAPQRTYTGSVVPLALPSFVVDIKQEILRAVAAGGLLTRQQIAKAVGRPKSTWLCNHIEALVSSGHLQRHVAPWRPNANQYFYEVVVR